MKVIKASMSVMETPLRGDAYWSEARHGTLSIDSDKIGFGDLQIPVEEVGRAVLDKATNPQPGKTLLLETKGGPLMFHFEDLPSPDCQFPFNVEIVESNPLDLRTPKKKWYLIGAIVFWVLLQVMEHYRGP